jgi:glucose/arabinose dehydrogenase
MLPSPLPAALAGLFALTLALPAMASTAYATRGSCAGHPRIALKVPTGWCVGLVATAQDGLQKPRRLLEVAPGRFWIVDMGSWEPRQGRLLELRVDGNQPLLRTLASGLDRPHGLARGPDGQVYIGEAGTIWRTPVGTALQREDLITGLPADGAHPLKELAFGRGGRLYINFGSASDACRNRQQQQPLPCPETTGSQPRAAVYLAQLGGPGFALQSLRPYATGLRNSLGLTVVPGSSGIERLWQAENSVDYSDAKLPAEELNELSPGSHHGWPSCVSDAKGRNVAARGYEGRARCGPASVRAPAMAWPAHVAPLQLLAVPPAAAGQPETPWSGRLLAVWHGHRAQGQRIVAWRLGADGRPQGPRENIVSGWSPMPGLRPLGNPAGITLDSQGRLWVVEDRNRTVLVVAPQVDGAAR